MIVLKSTHARVVADNQALTKENLRLSHRLDVEEQRSNRLAGEIATLRKGGPRDGRGHFVKRIAK